jgi:hypothetical protein
MTISSPGTTAASIFSRLGGPGLAGETQIPGAAAYTAEDAESPARMTPSKGGEEYALEHLPFPQAGARR